MYQTTDITIIIAHKPINRSCFKSATVSFGRGTPSHVLPCVFNTHPAMILSTLWIDVLFPSYIHQLSKLLLVHFRKEVFQCIYKHICIKQFFYLFPIHPSNLCHFVRCSIAQINLSIILKQPNIHNIIKDFSLKIGISVDNLFPSPETINLIT